jgi:hypothetical protein
MKYLSNPGGTFNWRVIAGTNRQSTHSFGMTIDINVASSNYWRNDKPDKTGKYVRHKQEANHHNRQDTKEYFYFHFYLLLLELRLNPLLRFSTVSLGK